MPQTNEFMLGAVNMKKIPFYIAITSLLVVALPSRVYPMKDAISNNALVDEGNTLLEEFYSRYATKEVDLVFVLDRSGSVPAQGWSSMLDFVEKILEHFTVDKDNTRVAVVTFSTTASVDINDLDHDNISEPANKCTLFSRMRDNVETRVPHGYTATTDALKRTYNILLNSRPTAKKAVLVLTDGKSNIGPPPVRIAFDIMSLRWSMEWDSTSLGPQVEVYAFGIENAYEPELSSMASRLPHHVFKIPKFSLFADFARSLHGGLQEENWLPTGTNGCGSICNSTFALCTCGSKIGSYRCVCSPGYELLDGICTACPLGYYKDNYRPEKCTPCPDNTTTTAIATIAEEYCHLLPGHHKCSPLPDIVNGEKFQVTGTRKDEVLNTNVTCDDVRDGNSCHYECDVGFRLSGSPVMVCNQSGSWVGDVPSCNAIDCHDIDLTMGAIEGADVIYNHNHTLFGSEVDVTCHPGRVPLPGVTSWSCDYHGRWTSPSNFQCAMVHCPVISPPEFTLVSPPECVTSQQTHGTTCTLTCAEGFVLQGQSSKTCSFTNRALWEPQLWPICKDIQSPVIICPDDVKVTIPYFNQNQTMIHPSAYQNPVVTDNSWTRGQRNYSIQGVPEGGEFQVGTTVLRYVAIDAESNTMNCTQNIQVIEKTAEVRKCPGDVNRTGRSMKITWDDPEFIGPDGTLLPHSCTPSSGSKFAGADNKVVCYPSLKPDVQCTFSISVTPKECPMPDTLPPPAHGSLNCAENQHIQKVCRIMCQIGYSMKDLSKKEFRCRDDGTWNPELGNWPPCSKTGWARNVLIAQSMHIRYTGSCSENMGRITEAFKATMEHRLTHEFGPCAAEHMCTVQDVTVVCGDARRRRHADYMRNGASQFLDQSQRAGSWSKRASSSGIYHESEPTDNHRNKRSTTEFTIQYKLVVHRDIHNLTDQTTMANNLMEIMMNVTDDVNAGNVTFDIGGELAVVEMVEDLGDMPEFPLNCSQGQVSLVDMENMDEISVRCVTCAPGSYLSDDDCVLCSNNTYQPDEGQTECLLCPLDTVTLATGAWNISQCRSACVAGSYSSTGYEPCTLCSEGQYQPDPQQTVCKQCPDNTTTAHQGAALVDQCAMRCGPGTFSKTGLGLCTACPPGTYQPANGQVECMPCDYDDPTQDMEQWCPAPVDCVEWDTNCVNGFCVSSISNYTICKCDVGFHGDACELNIDDCMDDACLHGGTCHDFINGVICECLSGYSGARCEQYVGLCADEPCHNNASCIDQGATVLCICSDGYNGTTCSQEVNPCDVEPCSHGPCVAETQGFYCQCDPGYGGTRCEKSIDYCANVTCHHGGACTRQQTGFRCTCTEGFSGTTCDKAIDYCTPDPCHDNGRCINAMASYHCICSNGFYGDDCLSAADPGFDLTYHADEVGYVEQRIWEKLHNLSVCLWMRSSDKSRLGTILSYTAHSNWITTSYLDVFTLYDYSNLQIIVNGVPISTNQAFNDGNWHHICVTWMGHLGVVHIYVNGTNAGAGLVGAETHLEGKGTLVIGQRQLGYLKQYFDRRDSFVGSISQLNIYDHVLDMSEIDLLSNSTQCVPGRGNILSWTSVLNGMHGDLGLESKCLDPDECLSPGICHDFEYCVDKKDGYECRPCPSSGCPGDPAPLDMCSSGPCNNGATCVAQHHEYRCLCSPEYTGDTCDLLASTCDFTTCYNGGTCHEGAGGVYCACASPWRGRQCRVMYQPTCADRPCLNRGNCTQNDHTGDYVCTCPRDGRNYGANCEVLTPCERSPGPCISGATCVTLPNNTALCLCPPGYDGDTCYFVPPVTTTPDYCHGISCQHGGKCDQINNGFKCSCSQDYFGTYCEQNRAIENRIYDVSITLDMQYTPDLKQDSTFRKKIKDQVHKIYANTVEKSKLRVEIVDIRSGSVVVDMTLHHAVYVDGTSPGPKAMEHILYNQLKQGTFGTIEASTRNFKFNAKGIISGWVMYLLIAVVVMTILIIVMVVTMYFIIRKKKRSSLYKLNNMPMCDISRSVNQAFECDSAPPTPRMRNVQQDNIYDDLNEPSPYAIDVCSGGKDSDPDLSNRFPSKKGRDINKDWANWQRQSIPLPPKPGEPLTSNGREDTGGYMQACKGQPPPSYRDVHLRDAQERYGRRNLHVDSEYILPMTAEEERYSLDKDLYLQPSEARKDNISKAKGLHVYINTQDAEPKKEQPEVEQPTYLPLLPNTPEATAVTATQQTEQEEPQSEPTPIQIEEVTREASPDYLLLNEEIPVSNFEAPKPIMRDIRKAPQPESPPVAEAPPAPLIDSPPLANSNSTTTTKSQEDTKTDQGAIAASNDDQKHMQPASGMKKSTSPEQLRVSEDDLDKDIPLSRSDSDTLYAIGGEK